MPKKAEKKRFSEGAQHGRWTGSPRPYSAFGYSPESRRQSRYIAYLAALLTALLNIAMFPILDSGWLAYVAFIPLLLIVPDRRPVSLFWYYLIAGFLFRLGNLYWIYHVIQYYSSLTPLLAAGIVLLLCIYLGIFWGLCGYLLGVCCQRLGFATALFLAPFLWVVFEWVLNLMQFPWCLSGYSQHSHLRIAQFATIFGVYGISWLIVAINSAVTTIIILRKYYYSCIIGTLLIIVVLYGQYRISRPIEGNVVTVGGIQGNVPQDVKIDYSYASEVNEKQIEMTKEILRTSRPDIIFWSESSTLYALEEGGGWSQEVYDLARRAGISMLIGSDSFVGSKVYNRAFLVDKEGRIVTSYAKMYLVPFGEYVPFQSLLFFAGKVVPGSSDFSPGEEYTLFPLQGKQFAVQICFEVVFPQLSRQFCRHGASLMTTITNDAWFGETSAPYQHFAMAVMRAIETRRYMVRIANTGVSGIIDPYGRILNQTGIFVPAKFTSQVKLLTENTFYTDHGDILIYACFVMCMVVMLYPKG